MLPNQPENTMKKIATLSAVATLFVATLFVTVATPKVEKVVEVETPTVEITFISEESYLIVER